MREKLKIQPKEPISTVLKTMKLRETKTWPILRFTSVRAAYQIIALKMNYKFTSKINRADGVKEVTRIV